MTGLPATPGWSVSALGNLAASWRGSQPPTADALEWAASELERHDEFVKWVASLEARPPRQRVTLQEIIDRAKVILDA